MISYNSLNFNPFMFIMKSRNVNAHNIRYKNTTESRAKQPIGNKTRQTFVRLCAKCFAWLVLRRSCVAGDTGEEKRQPVYTKTLQRKMSEVIDKPGRKEYNTHRC